jgi:hypothetical protein
MTWEWFGHVGHLIVGQWCRFHLCTKVGPWLVSTVGEYVPDEAVREISCQSRGIVLEGRGDDRLADYMRKVGFEDIGAGRKYETMVFRLGTERCSVASCACGMPQPSSWNELDGDGYNNAGDARRGHMAMCERWADKTPESVHDLLKEAGA